MNQLLIIEAVKGATYLVGKYMDGKKTKTGAVIAVAGAGVGALTVAGVSVTPEMVENGIVTLLGLFELSLTEESKPLVGVLVGGIMTTIGTVLSLYGYEKKGKFVVKGDK